MLQEIQQYQNTPYCIEPESSIQKYILSQDPQGDATPRQWEETLFEQSRSIEPKDQPPKRAVSFFILRSLQFANGCVTTYCETVRLMIMHSDAMKSHLQSTHMQCTCTFTKKEQKDIRCSNPMYYITAP